MQILKEEVKKNILNEAKKAFLDKGFDKASMRQIASASGITVGNVYRYFKNKNDLFEEVVKEAHGAIVNIIEVSYGVDFDGALDDVNRTDDQLIIDPLLNSIIKVFIKYRSEINILMYKSSGSNFENTICDFHIMVVNKIYNEIYARIDNGLVDFRMLAELTANTCIEGITKFCNSEMSDEDVYRNIYGLMFYLFQGAHGRIRKMEMLIEGEAYEKK